MSAFAEIQNEIREKGPITFARFMELALYSANGYYQTPRQIGKAGDFYTSVSVGRLFGELLARQISSWLKELNAVQIVEAGAHDGSLACDILTWFFTHQPDLASKVSYVITEPSAERQAWQQRTLESFRQCVSWEQTLKPGIRGVIFSNELLDAMPVHRLRWDATTLNWGEWFVGYENDKLIWRACPLSPELGKFTPNVPAELADVLPDGFTIEISPAAIDWWTNAARSLDTGRLLAIDYGITEQEFFRPDRNNGTARAYHNHRLVDDLLANPGEQDITAHVNWTAIQRAGETAGLRTETFSSQEQFLMTIVQQVANENWTAEQIRQLKTLTHPNFLGRAFRVLVQRRD